MSAPGVVLAHPSGNRFFRELAAALHGAGRLAELCTAIDWQGGGLASLLPRRVRAELERRSFSRELGVPVATHPWREVGRLAAARLGWRGLLRHETGAFSVDAVYRDFDGWVAQRLSRVPAAGIVYAYEDAAETTFAAAGRLGWRRVYDLPIAYWETSRRLLDEEAGRWPAWEPTLVGTRDSSRKQARKTRELAQADLVVCPS
ncbi:MAG TPA: glycosyl transferase family 1, partial [Opitutaceae bacterium]